MTAVKAIPDGYHTLTPYLMIRGAKEAIAFYERAFNAKEVFRMTAPDGRIGHAEIQIGDSRIMMADESADFQAFSPLHYGGTPVSLLLYVENVDALHAQAVSAGATEKRAPADQPYGDRMSGVTDPYGHNWYLATRIKDMTNEELQQTMQK